MKKLTILLTILVVSGTGCEYFRQKTDFPVVKPTESRTVEAPWLDEESPNKDQLAKGNYRLEAIPIEFICDNAGCLIPKVSAEWSNLQSDSVCIWRAFGGSGAITWQYVTEETHFLSSAKLGETQVDSVICQDSNGTLHFGTETTKIVP